MADRTKDEEIVIRAEAAEPALTLDFSESGPVGRGLAGRPSRVPSTLGGARTGKPRWSLTETSRRAWQWVGQAIEEEGRYGHGFLFVPVALGAGAVLWLLSPVDPPFWPLVVLFIVSGAVFGVMRSGVAKTLLLAISLVAGGMLLAQMEAWRRSTVILDSPVTTDLVGTIERSETAGPGRMRYIVSLVSTANPQIRRMPGQALLIVRGRQAPLPNGAVVSGRARLSPPAGPALPGLHDFAFSSYFDGIGAVGYFYSAPHRLEGSAAAPGWINGAERWLFDLRASIGNRIRALAAGDAGAFAAAIVTDERRAISDDTVEALRVAGLAHIVAISGLNMALAAGIFFVGLRTVLALFPGFAQAFPIKKIAAAGALAMVTAYYLISGFGVSAQRAYIMMAVILVAVLVDRPSISLRNVALSAIIILVWTPSEILGPSFQMSFAATVALVAGYAAWARRAARHPSEPLPIRHRSVMWLAGGWKFVAGIIMTSLIGSLATTMFSVEHFHRIATYGLAANLASMPIISFLVMPAGLIAMLLMPFGLDAPFIAVMAASLDWVIVIAKYVAGWGGDFTVGQQHSWFLPFGTAGLLLLTLLRTRLRYLGLPPLAIALAFFAGRAPEPPARLFVSEDGALVGFRHADTIAVNRERVPDFIYGQWRRARRLPDPTGPVMHDDWMEAAIVADRTTRLPKPVVARAQERMLDETDGRFSCQPKAWCALTSPTGVLIVIVEDGRFIGAACDVAGLVIAPRARFDQCLSGTPMLSGRTLRKTGSVEIDFSASLEARQWMVRMAMAETIRPWTLQRGYDWRRDSYDRSLPVWLVESGRRNTERTTDSVEVSANSVVGRGGNAKFTGQKSEDLDDPAALSDTGE